MAPKDRPRRRREPRINLSTYGITPGGAGISVPVGAKYASGVGNGVSGLSSPLKLDGSNLVENNDVVNASTTYGPDGKVIVPEGKTLDVSQGTDMQKMLGAEEAAKAKNVVDQGPNIVGEQSDDSVVRKGVNWVSSLFDTSDTFDDKGNVDTSDLAAMGGEFVFDGVMRLFQYGTDRINQLTTAGLSALPGGTRTLTWDEAGHVSVGQQVVANAAVSMGKMRRGEGNIFDFSALLGIPGIGAAIASEVDPNTPMQQKGWDITNAKDREVFNEGWERSFSFATDFGFAFADPTFFAGWAAKAGRLRYIDRVIDSDKKMYQIIGEAQTGKHVLESNVVSKYGDQTNVADDARKTLANALTPEEVAELKISPVAKFLHDVIRVDENGKKALSAGEIMKHIVIKNATNRDALSQAFYRANDYDEAMLVLRHAAGDRYASMEMLDRRPDILSEILDKEREIMIRDLRADPKKQAEILAQADNKIAQYDLEIETLRKQAASDPEVLNKIKFVKERRAREQAKRDAAESFDSNAVYQTDEYYRLSAKRLEYLEKHDGFLRAALNEADSGSNSIYGALRGSVKGFSSDTAFGRKVAASRTKRAKTAYETEMTRGAGALRRFEKATKSDVVSGSRLWQKSVYGQPGLSRVVNVWRYFGMEAPSGIVHIAGISAQESTREVSAMLNSIRMLGGKGRTVTNADGTTRVVGGVQFKEKILTEYQNAMLEGGVTGRNDTAILLDSLEDKIQKEFIDFYGLSASQMNDVFEAGKARRLDLREKLTSTDTPGRKFYIDEDGNQHVVPFMETQLQNAVITPPWREIEKLVMRGIKHETASDLKKGIERSTEFTFDKAGNFYAGFQDLWRPAVLLRLGYTQRTTAEGLFRSSAFQFSLAPIGLAARQLGKSTGNVGRTVRYGKAGTRGSVAAVSRAASDGTPFPRKFVNWRQDQVDEVESQIAQNAAAIELTRRTLAEASDSWRVSEIARLDAEAARLTRERSAIRSSNMTQDEIDAALAASDDRLDETYEAISFFKNIQSSGDEVLSIDDEMDVEILRYFETRVMPMLRVQRAILDDDMSASILYRQQTMAKRRNYQGEANVADSETLRGIFMGYAGREAFDPNDPYTNIALANLSSDGTNRQTAALRMNSAERMMMRTVTKNYVKVMPESKEYFDGLATMLGQWTNSAVGSRIISDIASGKYGDDEIAMRLASFLRDTDEGREISRFTTNESQTVAGLNAIPAYQRDEALEEIRTKFLEPERNAVDSARQAIKDAQAEVRDARKRLRQEQRTKPNKTALHDSQGKRITDPDKYVQRRRDALVRKEAALAKKEAAFVKGQEGKVKKTPYEKRYGEGFLVPLLSLDDAVAYGVEMVKRYRGLTADSPELQRYLAAKGLPISTTDPKAAGLILEKFIGKGSVDATGQPYQLQPVIGNATIELGTNSLMESVRKASALGFKWLGTIPEDTFVRAPFYGRRFEKTSRELMNSAVAQKVARGENDTLTLREINLIRDTAHRRALKDTKDWLYTIDRRTLLGQYAESIFPFISASQNSVTAVGRMVWNDPRIAALMVAIWNAPDRAGIADENGDMHLTLPLQWVPEGIRERLGLDAMQDIVFNKNQFNLVFPQSGFAGYVPTPGPIVVIPFSEMSKRGIFGLGADAPSLLVGVLGKENADAVWEVTKSYVYGSDEDLAGMSVQPFSIDKALPPVAQKALQLLQGEGGSSAYTSMYDKIYQSEFLQFAAGYRDEPTPEEIQEKTRNFWLLRMASNLVAFTPPGYTSKMQVITDDIRRIYETAETQDKAQEEIYRKYGSTVQYITKITPTSSVAGLPTTPDSIRFAEQNDQMISRLAPGFDKNGTLDVFGIFATQSNADYDPSISAAQQVMEIAGTNRKYREIRDPNRAIVDAQVSAGWTQYLKNMDLINSTLSQRGLKSLMSKGAEDLLETKRQMVEKMKDDPRFRAWYADYKNFSSTRTLDTVLAMETALNTKSFRENNVDSEIWGAGGIAEQYISERQKVIAALDRAGSSEEKSAIKEYWQNFRGMLAESSLEWAGKQERYLSGDDDPENPQVILTKGMEQYVAPEVVEQVDQYGRPVVPGQQEAMMQQGGM